jgi:hypothetical protein
MTNGDYDHLAAQRQRHMEVQMLSLPVAAGTLGPGIVLIPGSVASITKSSILGNDEAGSNCGLANQGGPSGQDATGNFWGAASGPGPDPADTIRDSFGASTVTTPFPTREVNVPPAAMR